MKTKEETQKALFGISGGLEMLNESKEKHLKALAELAIILLDHDTRERHGLEHDNDNSIRDLLATINFLLKDLNDQSVSNVKRFIHYNTQK